MATEHTPTPWKTHKPRRSMRYFIEADGRKHGDTGIEILAILGHGYQTVIGSKNCQSAERVLSDADAEFIVRACNNFDNLLAACKLGCLWLKKGIVQESIQYEDGFETVIPTIEAAIAAAEKE